MEGYYGITSAFRPSVCQSVFSFPDDNLSKCQLFINKLGVCIDIMKICFGIVNRQISSTFDSYLPAIRPHFHFRMITLVNIIGFSPNLVCAMILRRSGLELLMGKFCQFVTEISASNTFVFSFMDNNFSKCQWIFTKLGMCINIVKICIGIANGWSLSIFDRVICPQYIYILLSRQ